jgi:hypothetical protein
LVALLAAFLGFSFKKRLAHHTGSLNSQLEILKGRLAFQTAIAPSQTTAYQALWAITKPLSPRDADTLNVSAVKYYCWRDLRSWYYDEGNAM